MKTWISLTAILIGLTVFAQANKEVSKHPRGSKGDPMKMFDGLDLTEKQKADIKILFDKKKEHDQKVFEDKRKHPAAESLKKDQLQKSERVKKELTEEEKVKIDAKREEKRKEFDAEIKKILTADQFKKLEANRTKHFEEVKKNKGN